MDLFTLSALEVGVAMGSTPRSGIAFGISGPDGSPVGSVAMTGISLDGRFRRWFGNPAEYPFTLTVWDADGGVVLTVDKAREGTYGCYFEVVVRLADGRVIGRVRQRWPLSERRTFHGEADAEIASAPVGRLTAGFPVEGPEGEWARVEFEATPAGARRYFLRFADTAPVLVRALTLGLVVGSDAQLFPSGRAY